MFGISVGKMRRVQGRKIAKVENGEWKEVRTMLKAVMKSEDYVDSITIPTIYQKTQDRLIHAGYKVETNDKDDREVIISW